MKETHLSTNDLFIVSFHIFHLLGVLLKKRKHTCISLLEEAHKLAVEDYRLVGINVRQTCEFYSEYEILKIDSNTILPIILYLLFPNRAKQ